LIDQTVRSYGGKAQIDFRAKGLSCQIELPLGGEERPVIDGIRRIGSDTLLLAKTQDQRSTVLTGRRMLVVEDEPLVAMDIRTSLVAAGCEVLGPAGTIAEAKALIEHASFDAALLDLNIEGVSSEELAQMLARKDIPFAFVTGYRRMALPESVRESLLLPKPFDREQLIAIAEALVYVSAPSAGVVRLRRGGNAS
jgi:CheY-like chemotaxis protein